ncbi:alpha/beta fold hydrolase [Mycolicibacterium sp. P9-64]|uniref:alpha/beta hydrolase n=1 Tax=Mycolicibacterium sp. P9-64 TaxID=2024612 RepID=UPI0011EFE732|nr:alpha/beta fold hydrolase [Mycolicibacterium sp. P9-64]KAA0084451.1 alpha/beta fold hydrolase [Mycolicibacterium sp. P9-64]
MEADPTTRPKPPILFLHGVFGKPSLLQPWKRLLESEGYVVHAPALPGREPTDDAVLAGIGIEDCFTVALDAYDQIGEPAIVIGHSMGGLLTQKVAAAREPRAAVLLAPVPPGILWPQLRSLPHLFALVPKILAGKPLLPSARTMREVPLNTLPTVEREALIPELVRDSGRVFREMSTGAASTRVAASQVRCPVLCVSAGSDRNVAPWISRRIAKRYGAEHQDHPGKPHWIIAESAIGDVAPPVLEWLRRTVT